MPVCRDPLVANLRAQGFNTLRVPRKDYIPGTVLFQPRSSGMEVFGTFASAFLGVAAIKITESSKGATFSGTMTSSYRRGVALKLASAWLGLPEAGLRSLFSGANKFSFRFGDLRVLTTPLGELGASLAASEATDALLRLPESRSFIVHEVIQAKRIFCVNEEEGRASFGIHADETITEMAKIGLEADSSKAAEGMIVFSSKEFHTIGFKAFEIEIADGEYSLRRSLKTSGFTGLDDEESNLQPAFFDDLLL